MATKFIIHTGKNRKEILSKQINNQTDLLDLFNQFNKIKKIDTLTKAISRFEHIFKIDFYKNMLQWIFYWVMEYETDSITLLEQNITDNRSFTAKEIRYWLSNAFLLNVDSCNKEHYGELTFGFLYQSGSMAGEEKLLCILCYFYSCIKLDENRIVSFNRHVINENPKTIFKSNAKINTAAINIHTNNMESVNANAFVNFANKQLSYGITNSCTQEEILNACCPETYLALLFCESMKSNEVIIIKGARRFSTYSGFLNAFKWTGMYQDNIFQDQIGLDACTKNHFSVENVNRDIMKAYMGFKLTGNNSYISSGGWGCGAFGGDPIHKFLQQLLVVSVIPNIKLHYSTYGNLDLANKFRHILEYIDANNVTVGELYGSLCIGQMLGF